jgi:23S rRNA (adenine2503-C2)-methyltransferase
MHTGQEKNARSWGAAAAYLGPMGDTELFGLPAEGIVAWCRARGLPAFRGRQLATWFYARRTVDYAVMTDLPEPLRARLSEEVPVHLPRLGAERRSKDGTRKFLVELCDGQVVESVWMPMRPAEGEKAPKITACISTQVGCALGCTFCATATLGLKRNLTPGEIAAQVLLLQNHMTPERLTNIVLMGMGEPLHNFDSVVSALGAITGEPGMKLAAKRVTVSTVGLVPEIYRLAEIGLGVRLAISLNATTDAARSKSMPVNRRYPLATLMEAARHYATATEDRVTFEYVVIEGQNDTREDALRLAALVRGIPCKINLIPYNVNPQFDLRRPATNRLTDFRDVLFPRCPAVTIRYSKGADIGAACGQLAATRK